MKILLAISGGIDSIYLGENASKFFPGATFGVAHCNFSLRGEESERDEEFVREWSSSKDLPFFSARFDTAEYCKEHAFSIEMGARELRYRWFGEICRAEGFDAVAVAHNADDNAETLILNLLRGCGTRGLRGMGTDSPLPYSPDLRLLRPMLGVSREEIEAWMKGNGVGWREDRTNSETVYKRNKIRHLVLPVFKEINPSYLKTLSKDMAHLAMENDITERYFLSLKLGSLDNGVNVRSLMKHDSWEWLLYRLCEPYGISEETFGKLVELLRSGRTISSKVFQTPSFNLIIKGKVLSAVPRARQ